MRFVHVKLENWRNFLHADVALQRRIFLVGPNASGKSNFLDALKFLRDVADEQGGFQRAVHARRGVSQIRSLHARRYSTVVVDVDVDLGSNEVWGYRLEFTQDKLRRPLIKREIVRREQTIILDRPDREDKGDPNRLTQTHLEQVNANKAFRELAQFLGEIRYLHLVPQLVRDPDRSVGRAMDPYGGDFLEQLAKAQRAKRRTLDSRLRRIQDALRVAVPQLKDLVLERDDRGVPHLKGLYEHWRPNAGWQTEEQFSDGTLRLLGLLWVLLDGTGPLLLEEPELSLHAAVVRHIPQMMARLARKSGRQVFVSTHSADLLADEGIAPEEVLILTPSQEGTRISLATSDAEIQALLEGGLSIAEAVLPRTAPQNAQQLALFGD
ncbi:MAG: AAA family ATPase [Deltaproteobacteria bacterium]|nr:AAA family ATPase [Deltaproteobacteria bacterium]